jgi:glycosyltransferase involved in cell wall biosynthesis
MNTFVSVIITCYDLGEFLQEAIDSVLPDVRSGRAELIVVDDGSKDPRTLKVLDELDVREFRCIRQVNQGLAMARNNGIAVSNGDLIIPLDADNRLRPAFIPKAIEIMSTRPDVDVVHGDMQQFGDVSGIKHVGDFDPARLLVGNYIDACACIRKQKLLAVGGYDHTMPCMGWEDWDLWLRLWISGSRFHYIPEPLFDYRVRGGSMLSTTNKNQPQLVDHVFNKPELRPLRAVREKILQWKMPPYERFGTRELLKSVLLRWGRKMGRIFKRDPHV